jgi:hypothetical protein
LAPHVVSRLDIVAKLGALGVPAAEAYRLSGEITDSAGLPIGAGIELRYDREEHWRDLNSRLRDAAERVVARRRGRPPARAGRLR